MPLAGGKSNCQGRRRVPAPLAAQKCRYPGPMRGPAPLTAQKCRYPGRRRVPAPLVGGKGSRRGRRRGSAPLVGGKAGCQGRRRALVPLAMPEGWLLGWVGNKDTVQMVSAATACFPRAQFLPVGNTQTHLGSCVGSRRFPLHRWRIRGVMIRWYGSERSDRGRLGGTPLSHDGGAGSLSYPSTTKTRCRSGSLRLVSSVLPYRRLIIVG